MLPKCKVDLNKMRGLQEMKKDGMQLSSPSDDVAKLWDAVMFQSYGFFDDPRLNGIQGTIAKIQEKDSGCPLLKLYTIEPNMENFETELCRLKRELNDQHSTNIKGRKWTEFEKTQIQAFIYGLEGYDDLAQSVWSDQLAKNPRDLMSLKQVTPVAILKGSSSDIATLAGYCSKALKEDNIYYSFVRSYEAYGIEERGQYDLAMDIAKDSLSKCPWNTWCTHTIAHIYDSKGQPNEGLKFMNGNMDDWSSCSLLSCHNNWHMALFNLDILDISGALQIYDEEILPHLKNQFSFFQMSDAVSFLTRIKMKNYHCKSVKNECDISERLKDLFALIEKGIQQRPFYNFYDAHSAMAMMCNSRTDLLEGMRNEIIDWISKYENRVFESWETDTLSKMYSSGRVKSNKFVTRTRVLTPFIEGLRCLNEGEYQSAVEYLYPIRHQFKLLGGSKAQNDVFNEILAGTLLVAGGNDNTSFHEMLAFERGAERGDYGMRMQADIVYNH